MMAGADLSAPEVRVMVGWHLTGAGHSKAAVSEDLGSGWVMDAYLLRRP
jgi:hypothetical protein